MQILYALWQFNFEKLVQIVHNIYDFALPKKGCKEIDIAATLEHIRDQRGGMVQNRQQFEFCLMAVAEEVHAILKALPQQQPQQ